jgi:hypothetical protein
MYKIGGSIIKIGSGIKSDLIPPSAVRRAIIITHGWKNSAPDELICCRCGDQPTARLHERAGPPGGLADWPGGVNIAEI